MEPSAKILQRCPLTSKPGAALSSAGASSLHIHLPQLGVGCLSSHRSPSLTVTSIGHVLQLRFFRRTLKVLLHHHQSPGKTSMKAKREERERQSLIQIRWESEIRTEWDSGGGTEKEGGGQERKREKTVANTEKWWATLTQWGTCIKAEGQSWGYIGRWPGGLPRHCFCAQEDGWWCLQLMCTSCCHHQPRGPQPLSYQPLHKAAHAEISGLCSCVIISLVLVALPLPTHAFKGPLTDRHLLC